MDRKEHAPGKADSAPPGPPYRNLRVWIESFDLALDVFQIARRLEGSDAAVVGRRLMEASARMPVAVARGQSSGSATEFIRCLQEGLSDLAALETRLLMAFRTSAIAEEDARRCESRILEIRRMAWGLIRRLRAGGASSRAGAVSMEPSGAAGPARPDASQPAVPARGQITRIGSDGRILTDRGGEKGSALVLSVLVTAALAVLGLTFLQLADAESRISARGRERDQLLNVAEAGARAVKTWFDAPVSGRPGGGTVRHPFLGRIDLRDPGLFDRTRRLLDHDGDPATPPVPADGTAGRELYRQNREIFAGFPHLDLFGKPYRRGPALSLSGTQTGPDVALEDRPGVVDLIDELNLELFGPAQSSGRLERIEVYGPPVGGPAGAPGLGVATVKVTAALHHRLDRSGPVPVVPAGMAPIARSVVRMGLAEIPANAPRGPLESCGDITARGVLRARWGRVIAVGDVTLAVHLDTLDATVASAFPYASYGRRLSGLSPGGDLADWLDDPDTSIEDPWLKVVAGGDLVGHASRPDQPYPYDPARAVDIDHSNLFQRVAGITCPSFDYALWKRIALSSMPGDRHVHYFAFDAPTGLFRENGTGPARSVRDFTHGRQGIFFFDTVDGSPPAGGNLTPAVSISGGEWSTAGVVYLNAVSFRVASVAGVERVLIPPGEPFDDPDHDLAHAPFETWVNLRYPTSLTGAASDLMHKDPVASQSLQATSPDGETHEASTTTLRDASGLPVASPVNLFGVLFNAGNIVAEGDAVHYGSFVAGGDVVQTTWGADTPIIYFDERLNTGSWPPPEIAMPRTFVTFWQTSRP